MSDDVFRLVIAVAVLLACIAFVVQAGVAIVFYAAVRRLQARVEEVGGKIEDLADKAQPVIEKMAPVVEKALPLVERIGPMMDTVLEAVEKTKPVLERTAELIGKAVPVVENARDVVAHTGEIVAEARPYVIHFSEEAIAAARAAREQVERIGGLVQDASQRVHARLEQIDQSLEHTVGQVGQVGDAMKRAVMRPVREANGVAAGISAAVATLVRPRRSGPDAVAQDEEMFI
jgi:methyl-accepting chemotaxis protein